MAAETTVYQDTYRTVAIPGLFRRIGGVLAILPALMAATAAPGRAGAVLDRVRQDGVVRCSIDQTPGFSGVDAEGRPVGFEVDFCRAVAAAVLGKPDAISLSRISSANKFKALQAREIDIALGQTTWTFTRDTAVGASFPAVLFYDGQGILTWNDAGIATAAGLAGKRLCVQSGTTSIANLQDFTAGMKPAPVLVELSTSEEKVNAFLARRCDATTGDRSELAALRATAAGGRTRLSLLADSLSREPLSPAVSDDDSQWFHVVRWVAFAQIAAEAKGLTQATIGQVQGGGGGDGEVRRLAGLETGIGGGLGLDDKWARRVIEQVGNYGEMFERNLGSATPLGLERGQNALWKNGGLMFAPPFR